MQKYHITRLALFLGAGICASISSAHSQTALNPTADTYVRGGPYASSNFGSSSVLQLKTSATADVNRDVYFKFDVASVSSVTSAKLRIFANLSASGSVGASVYPVSDTSWTESTLTWNTKPALGATALSSASVNSTTYTWYELDVTSYVSGEKSAGRNTISLALHCPATSTPNININSREATSGKPELVIGGSISDPAPTVSITSPANGSTYTALATIAISASASDSNGSISKVDFLSGSTVLATDTSIPYSTTWNSVSAGNYALTAKATDNAGIVATSSIVNVIVNASSSSSSGGSCGNGTGPTDNPIATKYGSSAYPWTANIKWNCVYNINNYSGTTALAKYNAARDEAAANGGGVVYFPAGIYDFGNNNLVLKNGVVIRGASTTADAKSGRTPGSLAPTTKFVFADREHKGFYNNSATDSNIGIVNIDSDGGAVMFFPSLVTGGSNLKSYWWVATDINGMGKNKIVFGCRIRNVSYKWPNPDSTSGNVWPYRFSTAIACYTDENALVANNLLGAATKTANTSVSFSSNTGCNAVSGTFPYHYDNRYGIDVNRNMFGGVLGAYKAAGKISSTQVVTPTNFPWMFRRGIVIRDNYVYMNGRVGIMVSGNGNGSTRGSGSQILNNHVEIKSGTMLYSVTGDRCAGGQSTNENRGYDQTGYANNFDGNTGNINRQQVPSGYPTTDGEGLLHQDTNSNIGYQNVWNKNNLSGGSNGYMAYYKLTQVKDCTITGNTINSGEILGVVGTSTAISGNVCSGNSKSCTNF